MLKSENEWMKEFHQTSRVYILIGIKGSGKSYFINSVLKYSFKHNIHKNYFLVIPSYKFEQNDSYSYIKDQKNKNVKIYNKYHDIVGQHVLDSVINTANKSRSIFIIDDATGFLNVHNMAEHLKYLITTTRHVNCDLIIACHGAKNVLSSILRSNVDYLLFFKIINSKLLETIYEEYLSVFNIFRNKKDFITYFNEKINNVKYNCLFIDLINNNIEFINYLKFNILSDNNNNGRNNENKQEETNKGGIPSQKEGIRTEKISGTKTASTTRNPDKITDTDIEKRRYNRENTGKYVGNSIMSAIRNTRRNNK